MSLVPAEILARGSMAIKAYKKALEQGMTRVMRVPIMIIGQERSGKTSLKKSLKGQLFNPQEESTHLIERDPSYFSVTTEMWKAGETETEPHPDADVSLHNRVARIIVADLTGDKNDLSNREPSSRNLLTSKRGAAENLKVQENAPVIVKEKGGDDIQQHSEKTASQTARLVSKIYVEENDEEVIPQEVPHATAEYVEKFLKESKETSEEKVYSTIWDFGGQSVYYATHPIFLTDKAIYLLVYDLSKKLQERATPPEMEGVFERKVDLHCSKTNEDYLHFWLSSVSSLASQHTDDLIRLPSGKLPKGLPPVILVCTHADQCQEDAKDRARKIYGTLRSEAKPYGKHLCKTYFVVDNTTSGRGDECPDVHRLRKEILAVTEQLPQLRQLIPIKWLRFEDVLLKNKKENGEPFISLEEARMVALECGIEDDEQFVTLLNFLHDQRILIHFDDTPELMNMVILDPQWLIDLFRKVITVKPYDPTADERYLEEMWTKLETDGILDDKLLQIVWSPLLKKETTKNLIAVMEKFSLVCSLPSVDNQKQFLVPSMLMSHPDEVANKLLHEAFIPPLFIRFNQPHPLRHPGDDADCGHLQVPLGLFPRLIVKFLQWSIKNEIRPLYQDMYQNFARFPILSKGYSVILHCRSSCIEVVVHRDPDIASDTTIAYKVRRLLDSILQSIREECFWLKTMEYEFSVSCPVCCNQRSVLYCKKHQRRCCEKEDCLHFWPEHALVKEQLCTRSTFATSTVVPMKQVSYWFEFPGIQVTLVPKNDTYIIYNS